MTFQQAILANTNRLRSHLSVNKLFKTQTSILQISCYW